MAISKLKRKVTIGGLLAGAMFLALPAGAWADESCTIRIVDNTAISTCPDPNAGTALLGGNDETPPKIAPPDSSNSSDSSNGTDNNTSADNNKGGTGNGGDTGQQNGGDTNQPAPPNVGGPLPGGNLGDQGPLAGASGFDEDDTSSAVSSNRLRSILGPKSGR